jgi:SAM-dependent MidA family methyltransferase
MERQGRHLLAMGLQELVAAVAYQRPRHQQQQRRQQQQQLAPVPYMVAAVGSTTGLPHTTLAV